LALLNLAKSEMTFDLTTTVILFNRSTGTTTDCTTNCSTRVTTEDAFTDC